MVTKKEKSHEMAMLNDGLQFWKGYVEAILWVKNLNKDSAQLSDELDKQSKFAMAEFSSMKEQYDDLLKRKRNARYSK